MSGAQAFDGLVTTVHRVQRAQELDHSGPNDAAEQELADDLLDAAIRAYLAETNMTGGPVQVVGDALLGLLPSVYGHRLYGEPGNIDGTPLGRDASAVVSALRAAGCLARSGPGGAQ